MEPRTRSRYLFAVVADVEAAHSILDIGGGAWVYGDQELTDLVTLAIADSKIPVVMNCGQDDGDSCDASR